MRQILYRVCLVFGLATLTACQATQNFRTAPPPLSVASGAALTVMSYNIRMGIGGRFKGGKLFDMPWGRNLDAVIAEIRAVDPDIVALQEVAGTSQAKTLGQALNLNYAYIGHETPRSTGSWWGVAILSKYPILESRGVEISFGHGNQRSIIIATLDMAGSRATFLSVHKDKDLSDGRSIVEIMDAVEPIPGPVTLIGDFNFTPKKSNGRLEAITKRFVDTATAVRTQGAREAISWGTFVRSKRRIDYVFSDPTYFDVLDVGVTLPDKPASDHRAYYAHLQWK
jgi:endonuclease/exonuclease/phosphatase family metal-dependent hydrolase